MLWNVYTDLKDARYATVDAGVFQDLVRRSGITPDSIVVFYGYAPALGLWMLRRFGHRDVRILNASRDGWLSAGGTLTAEPSRPAPSAYVLGPEDGALRAGPGEVRSAIGTAEVGLADVRSEAELRRRRLLALGGERARWPRRSCSGGGACPGARGARRPGPLP